MGVSGRNPRSCFRFYLAQRFFGFDLAALVPTVLLTGAVLRL
jgi:hypothetical protein